MLLKSSLSNKWKNMLWFMLPVILGILIIIMAPMFKSGPQKSDLAERPVKVRSLEVTKIDVIPRAIGYGKIVPARTWDAVAEVAGQVSWVADQLRDGEVIKDGTELLRIEDSNYRLALIQAEAQLRASKVKNKTARDGLVIAQDEFVLVRADYNRKSELSKSGAISKVAVDSAERSMLVGQAKVANLQSAIDLSMAEHQVVIAQRDAAKLDMERTRKIAPFDVRITTVNIGVAQYANKGQLMFSADGLDVAEVAAQFPLGTLRPLVRATRQVEQTDEVRQGVLSLKAVMRLHTATHSIEWAARVSHVTGTIDPQTQSLGVVVAVDLPRELSMPGQRPPLRRNTFVEVELFSASIPDQIVVPLQAVRQGVVYVIDTNSRLEKRDVEIAFSQKGYAVVRSGLNFGEHIVTSDLITAIDGMLLAPQEDVEAKLKMIIEATGKETVQ